MADQTCNPQHVTQALGIQATGPRTVIVPADPIIWDARTSYEYLTLVASTDFGQGYVSKQDVPSGTPLTDTDYWIPVASYNAQLAVIQGDVAEINSNLDTLSTKVSDHTTDVINALEYYTDDIGKTINTLVSQGHSNIYIPAGTYTASTTVNLVDKTGVTIWSDYSVNTYTGSNGGCVINQTHQGAMFNLIGATSCAIKGIKIVGKNLTYACGFVLGTTPTTQYSQYNSLENCAVVYNEADVDTYGFYDCQGEILSIVNCSAYAGHPIVLTNSDMYGICQKYGGQKTSSHNSTTFITLDNCVFVGKADDAGSVELENTANIDFGNIYTQGNSADSIAFLLHEGAYFNLRLTHDSEECNRPILNNGTVINSDIRVQCRHMGTAHACIEGTGSISSSIVSIMGVVPPTQIFKRGNKIVNSIILSYMRYTDDYTITDRGVLLFEAGDYEGSYGGVSKLTSNKSIPNNLVKIIDGLEITANPVTSGKVTIYGYYNFLLSSIALHIVCENAVISKTPVKVINTPNYGDANNHNVTNGFVGIAYNGNDKSYSLYGNGEAVTGEYDLLIPLNVMTYD